MSVMTVRVHYIRVLLGGLIAVVAIHHGSAVAVASGYTFKAIVDNTGYSFATQGSSHRQLNESGEVTFQALNVEEFQHFVFKGSGGNLTPVAGPPTFFGLNSGYGNGAIANNGAVVFTASVTGPRNGIYVNNGGTTTPLITSLLDPNTDLPERLFYSASTSPSGLVAFLAARFDFPDQAPGEINNGYYLFTGQGLVTLAEDGGTYDSVGGVAPIVNDAGQVAFLMGEGAGNTILRYDNGSLTTVKTGFNGGHDIWMNSSGDVIYADVDEVNLYSGGVTTTVASTDDGFNSLMKPGNADAFINDVGDVAFWGSVTEFNGNPVVWQGIYTGPDIVEDRVVVYGDTVLGHVINGTEVLGLNNAGQILFSVEAQSPDTWRALVVATPVPDGDFQEDGDVDDFDLSLWDNNFGLATAALHTQGDADDDDDVDGRDFLIWQREYGTLAIASAAVPEPTGGALVTVAVFVAHRRRRPVSCF